MIQVETDRATIAEALKLDAAEVGGSEGVLRLDGGVVPSSAVDWATNQDVMDGTSDVLVMSPLRTKEAHEYLLSDVGGVTELSTTISQLNTLNIASSKMTYFDTTDFETGSHFTISGIDQEITVNTTGIYRIAGTLSIEGDNGKVLRIRPHIDAVALGPIMHVTCLGTGNPVGWTYDMKASLIAGEKVTLYGTAEVDATNIYVTESSFGLEKIVHG